LGVRERRVACDRFLRLACIYVLSAQRIISSRDHFFEAAEWGDTVGGDSDRPEGSLDLPATLDDSVRESKLKVVLPMLRRMLAVWLVVLTAAGSAVAGSLEDALSAQKHGDYATALRLYKPLADQGDASAQYSLGTMYEAGQGVPHDYGEAAKWYRRAADQGDAYAQNNLGAMYEAGQGVPQGYSEAAKWYRKAADQGAARAQYNLGVLYDTGQGVPQDHTEAYKWYDLAAARLSKEEGREQATLGRDKCAAAMTPAEIAEARKRVREWKPE
jgi:hypothetical protein